MLCYKTSLEEQTLKCRSHVALLSKTRNAANLETVSVSNQSCANMTENQRTSAGGWVVMLTEKHKGKKFGQVMT